MWNGINGENCENTCKFTEFVDDTDLSDDEKKNSTFNGFNIIHKNLNQVVDLQIKNKLSYKATSDIVKLLNEQNTTIKLPTNKDSIKAYAYDETEYNFFLKCSTCDNIVQHNSKCKSCQSVLKIDSKKNNFLVHFPLETQLCRILNNHFDEIINYLNREHVNDVLSDVDEGFLYKNMRKQTPSSLHILALTLNVDGASIFKSSKDSMWPVQLVLNCLPPAIRYLPKNIIVSTVYYGRDQPDMIDLLYLLAVELDYLNEHFITIYKNDEFYNFVPKLLLCACDLPARAKVQNMKNTTGKFGCPFCYHPGCAVKNNAGRSTTRFPTHEATSNLRKHNDAVKHAQQVVENNDGKEDIYGIKGYCSLLLFDDVNIIDCVSIDVMHGVALNITKDLVEIWLGKLTSFYRIILFLCLNFPFLLLFFNIFQ